MYVVVCLPGSLTTSTLPFDNIDLETVSQSVTKSNVSVLVDLIFSWLEYTYN
jgi:hypothetical protein